MNYSRVYNVSQEYKIDRKGERRAKVALGPDGQPTFVAADTNAPRKPRQDRWTPNKVWSVCNLRINGIERLIRGRHRGPCDTDDGLAYFDMAAIHLVARRVARNHEDDRIMTHEWAKTWTPRLAEEKGRAWFDEVEARLLVEFDAIRMPPLPAADAVADALGIRHAEVAAYGLKTIGATDRRKKQRKREAKVTDRVRKADERLEDGSKPQERSMARTKPWEAYGMSRATYYRAVDRGEIQPHERMAKGAGKPTGNGNVLRVLRVR